MAYTYNWQDAIDTAGPILKSIGGFAGISVRICDMVSADMYIEYPWKDTITTIAKNSLPLLDGIQDYSSPINIYRLTKATLLRTDVTPNWTNDIDVADDLPLDLTPRSPTAIRVCCAQAAFGTLRLESAVSIPSGTLVQLIGEYQLNPVKIVSLGQQVWFKDQYLQVAMEGLLYWGLKLSDDPRAGGPITDANGNITRYAGQLGAYKAALWRMKMAEDYGAQNNLFPADPLGAGNYYDSLGIFGS